MMSEPSYRDIDGFQVAGIAVRTTNEDEGDPAKAKLPGLWQRFATESAIHQLGGGGPVGVITDYESDEKGAYTNLAGMRLVEEVAIPPGLRIVQIPAEKYLVFRSVGPLPQCVIEGWREVWKYFAHAKKPRRAFRTDFEQYGSDNVEICISIVETA
jgi:predicted transcriptional regulator YdeE